MTSRANHGRRTGMNVTLGKNEQEEFEGSVTYEHPDD